LVLLTYPSTMTRSQSSVLFLAETAPTQRCPRVRIHFLDYAFLTLVLIVICGGCLFVMDLAAAHSSGQSSPATQMLSQAGGFFSFVMHGAANYALLFLASIINSALIVALVQGLHALDRKFSRGTRHQHAFFVDLPLSGSQNMDENAVPVCSSEIGPFLLSPVFR